MTSSYVPSFYEPVRHQMVMVPIDEARRVLQLARTRAAAELDQIEKTEMEAELAYRLAYNAGWLVKWLPFLKLKTTPDAVRADCPSLKKNSASDTRLTYLILQGTVRLADKLLTTLQNETGNVPIKPLEWDRMRTFAQ